MRFKRIAAILGALLVAIGGFLLYAQMRSRPPRSLSAAAQKHLNDEYPIPSDFDSAAMGNLKRRALAGQGQAADRLVNIYESCLGQHAVRRDPAMKPSEAECERALDFWVEVAASNGTSLGANLQYNKLVESPKCEDVYRARFWLRRIPDNRTRQPWISQEKYLRAKERSCRW